MKNTVFVFYENCKRLLGTVFPYPRVVYGETASKWSVSLQVVINGGATSSGEQDNEDTELMAIYTTENGIAEKVPPPQPHPLTCHRLRSCTGTRMSFIWGFCLLPCWVGVCLGGCVPLVMEVEEVMRNWGYFFLFYGQLRGDPYKCPYLDILKRLSWVPEGSG